MRTTIDIDLALLKEAAELTKAKTKKEIVKTALLELIRQRRIERLRRSLGRFELGLDLETLEKTRDER